MVGPLTRHWHGAISSGRGQLLLLREKAFISQTQFIKHHQNTTLENDLVFILSYFDLR